MVAASMAPDHRRAPPLPAGVPGLAPPSRPLHRPSAASYGMSHPPPLRATPPPLPPPQPLPRSQETFRGDHRSLGGGLSTLGGDPRLSFPAPARRGRTSCAVPAPREANSTPGPHQLCCAGPTGTPARQGRTSCAVQAPQEPPHARAAPAVLCRPHRNPRTPGPHQLCCAGPTGNPTRQGRTSCAVQAPQETGSAPPRPRSCGSGARRQIAPSPVVGERRPEARGIGAPQVPEQVVPPASPPGPPPSRTGRVTLPPAAGEGSRVTHTGGSSLLLARAPPPPDMAPPPPPPPPSVVVGTRPASVTPADCSLAPCPGRACLAISPAGTCWVPSQQQQQQPHHGTLVMVPRIMVPPVVVSIMVPLSWYPHHGTPRHCIRHGTPVMVPPVMVSPVIVSVMVSPVIVPWSWYPCHGTPRHAALRHGNPHHGTPVVNPRS